MTTQLRISWLTFLFFTFLFYSSYAEQPQATVTPFGNLPVDLTYFEDSTNVVYYDVIAGDVWVSQDEGKAWNRVDDVPSGKAIGFVAHPFDRHTGFILTAEKKHYRTNNQGKTWQSFTVPASPAVVPDILSFHSKKPRHVLYQAEVCEKSGWWSQKCVGATLYTINQFDSEPNLLLDSTRQCRFAHSSKEFKHSADEDLIFCVAHTSDEQYDPRSSKLYSSTDFFQKEKKTVVLPNGNRDSNGVIAIALVSKFAVVAVRDLNPNAGNEMWLYVSLDAEKWAKGQFPHASSSTLKENAYTIVESTTHSLAVDVLLYPKASIGTLFVSNSNGTYFVESLQNTNRNAAGFVDYESVYGVEGVGLANVVHNAPEVDGRGDERQITSFITFDDGSNWAPLTAPSKDVNGKNVDCDISHPSDCSLHLHSVTTTQNLGRIFSSPAPGYVFGVGSIGDRLLPYEQCGTFLSTDNGVTWKMVHKDAHKYEFGDKGSLLVLVNDEEATEHVSYSTDAGTTWHEFKLPVKIRAKVFTTVPDSTSQKFLLIGTLHKSDMKDSKKPHAIIFLDFLPLHKNQCTDKDLERWDARDHKRECIMGHKQWYMRKKPEADCFMGDKFEDPVEHEDNCECTESDFECDFNFIRVDGKCEPQGREPVPEGVCEDGKATYRGSSGYRLIPGNTCKGGLNMSLPKDKDCSNAQPPDGEILHRVTTFDAELRQHEYFKDSQTILARFSDNSIWQSSNEGFSWTPLYPDENFILFSMHKYANDRAYLITSDKRIYSTSNQGKDWERHTVPHPPNSLGIVPVMAFHPQESDWLIWIGSTLSCLDPDALVNDCHTEAYYSTNNGGHWGLIEKYVKGCQWGRDTDLKIDRQLIICASYHDKKGSQRSFTQKNSLELWEGSAFYKKKNKIFNNIIGFTKFAEYLIVAEYQPQHQALDLQVSLDGKQFSRGLFPPSLRLDNHAYTILESSTDSVFLHLTVEESAGTQFGHILKSNSNGTFYSVSLENANRNDQGFVDFEKMIGLDGIALVNVVGNPQDAVFTKHKKVQSRITHNDGGSWKSLTPPEHDSNQARYGCQTTRCSLHVHGYTERLDPRATYSTPSVPGLLMAVGNVGEELAPYSESDTFLSRDGGFTWEEVHKDAHTWEFGDSGSILVMANDEQATDRVLFSTDQGLNWNEYIFGDRVRVRSIVTVPSDTSRKFILFGSDPKSHGTVAIQVDFSHLKRRQCLLDEKEPENDDFELWSPSEERDEKCLFGRKTLFHRRIRDRDCFIGNQPKVAAKIAHNCTCKPSDFECEFNFILGSNGKCNLQPGLGPLPDDDSACLAGEDSWYERTAYRKIPFSSCDGGDRPDRGKAHQCPGPKNHGTFFWIFWISFPFAFCGLAGWWYTRKSGLARGQIRLSDFSRRTYSDSGVLDTLASVPYFLIGLAGIAWEWVSSRTSRTRRGYRTVPIDEDAQVLRFEDEE